MKHTFLLFLLTANSTIALGQQVEWTGQGAYRVLIRVDPVDIGKQQADELPAEVPLDLAGEIKKLANSQSPLRADLSTIQVMQYDPDTGSPIAYPSYAYAKSPADRPFAWYDGTIPYEFPEVPDTVDRTQGKIVRRTDLRGGYFFNAIGDGDHGRLAWVHTQTGGEPSYYAIYFNAGSREELPNSAPPRGWIGDGLPRFDEKGGTSFGADHCRIDVDDWDDDGLLDIVVGEAFGHVFWLPNRGTANEPRFPFSRFLSDAEGVPIDAGDAATPKVVDWDGDGLKDLLVGTEWNRILYYRNTGTNKNRQLAYQGLVQADGATLILPITPVAEASESIFKRDYYPVLETVDWDGDGDVDLLSGGYITGRIYVYENTGRGADGQPQLAFRSPIEDENGPLNVGDWCAAPCAADFDGDGDLDLMSGNMPIGAARSREQAEEIRFLRYYENSGTRRQPSFRATAFPKEVPFPHGGLATPRSVDWDADGDLDLIVSARDSLFLFKNVGTPSQPQFDVNVAAVEMPWGQSPLPADQLLDWNGDGKIDLISGYTVRLNTGKGNPFDWSKIESVLPRGETIAHPSGIGDDWFWPWLDDFDEDGRVDVLFGDWHGHVWLHRNLSTPEKKHFDTDGVQLALKSGGLIKVGPIAKDINKDFDALQGARTVFAVADFERDGTRDLVVGDTYGKLRYFRNVGTKSAPLFADPVDVGDLGIRLLVTATDWNSDGRPDIIAGAANGRVRVFLNRAAETADAANPFAEGFDPNLPPIPQPRVLMADLNGDGDEDLYLPSTQGSVLVERSFLTHGYAKGVLLGVEEKPK